MLGEVTRSLLSTPPSLPAKLHYDERGSQFFEEICEQPEYTLTRTEIEILRTHGASMADAIGPNAAIIEPGSGAGIKIQLLINALEDCAGYIPSDISDTMLAQAAARFAEQFPGLPVQPLHADFMQPIELPDEAKLGDRRVVYFPGSTIGNFGDDAQRSVLRLFADLAGDGGALLVGFDLVKAVTLMERAYNDAAGVTAEFNLNMIDRLRSEFGIDIDRDDFEFQASWYDDRQAIVSHLHALRDVTIPLGDAELRLKRGDRIQTEESHKYTDGRIADLAAASGLNVDQQWRDSGEQFAVVMLSKP